MATADAAPHFDVLQKYTMEAHKSQILKRDSFRCVFCGRDMLHDQESYLAIAIDHLIPKKDKDEKHKQTTEKYINDLKNKVLCCRNCKALKGDFIVQGADLENFPENREAYISEVRKHVSIKRSKALAEFIEATKIRAEQVGGQNSGSCAASV